MFKFSRLVLRIFALFAFFLPVAAQAQPAAPVGLWSCVVNSPVVSIQLQMQVSPDRTLMGQGQIYYVGTSAVYDVQGYGDWTALPPEPGAPEWMFKFRMHPSNHAIFSWFARPTSSPGNLYNVFQDQQTGAVTETACQRIG